MYCTRGIHGGTDLCVSAGEPWGDGRCGRTCHSMGSPWRTSPGCAHDAGAEMAECSLPPFPLPPRHLEHTQGGRDKWKVCWVPLQTSPPHIATQHILFYFFPSPVLPVCHCPSFSLAQMCEQHTKSNASNRFTGCAVSIPSRTLTVHKLFFRKTIVLRYTATHPPPTPTPWKPTTPPPVFLYFYPSYHHHSY